MSNFLTSMSDDLRLTRITNSCVLIEIDGFAVLTDPWFSNPWGFNEDPGLKVEELPRLSAIIGSHFAPDHWGIGALRHYPHRLETPVFTATQAMARRAKKIGFSSAECLTWNEKKEISKGLTLEVVEAHKSFGKPTNNYVLSSGETRVFFGGETRRLQPLRAYRASNPAVDIALAPSNGMCLLGYQLVTTADEGLAAARILGAHTFVPIHDSMHAMGFGGPTSSSSDLIGRAEGNPRILFLKAGKKTVMLPKMRWQSTTHLD